MIATPARSTPWLRAASLYLWGLGAGVSLGGVALASATVVSGGTVLIALGFAAADVADARRGGITPITLFAVGVAMTGIANAIGLLAADTPRQATYFLYAVEEYLFEASLITLAGGVLPVVAFRHVARSPAWRAVLDILPRVRGVVDDRTLVRGGTLLAAGSLLVRVSGVSVPLGTIMDLVYVVPSMAAFTLARAGTERGARGALPAAGAIAAADALRAMAYAYLRMEVLLPLVAFTLGAVLGRRSFAVLRSPWFLPVYGAIAVFVLYFGALAQVRTQTGGGVQRVQMLLHQRYPAAQLPTIHLPGAEPDAPPPQTLLSRLTSFNQVSQVVRIAREDGFLNGQTLEYLGFAFIPRFLWPGKPLIAKGQWFAVRIGQGYVRPDGSVNNSVNMTIPGELYMNFGWLGVFLGCLIFGAFLAVLWTRVGFWTESRNVLGAAFGYYILWVGFGLGADLQIVVTLVATYLLFVAAGTAFAPPAPPGRHLPRRAVAHRPVEP